MLTHRFNWMGAGHSESAVAVVVSLRDTNDFTEGSLRNRDYEQRRHVAHLIRERLDRIKEELGLMPASMERDPSPAQTDTSVFSTPQQLRSARGLAASIRSLLLGQGEAYISYIDGSAHQDWKHLLEFNRKAREEIIKQDPQCESLLPPDDSFGKVCLEKLLAKETVIRQKLDAMRVASDLSYVTTFVAPEGGNIDDLIREEEDACSSSLSVDALETQYRAAREETRKMRAEWGAKAAATGKALLENASIRTVCAQLHQQSEAPHQQ